MTGARGGELLQAALGYARGHGWPVFPLRAGTKVPMRDSNGVHDATTDPGMIGLWWTWWPDANIGIATGMPGPGVLDIDIRDDGDGREGLRVLDQAGLTGHALAVIRTPAGMHLYYTGTAEGCHTIAARHIDYRGAGGYVVAPPSVVDGRPYTVARRTGGTGPLDWAACAALLVPERHPARRHAGAGPVTPYARLSWLARWVAAQPEGNRNAGLFWAACRAVENGLDPSGLADAAEAAGLRRAEAERTIASARKGAGP